MPLLHRLAPVFLFLCHVPQVRARGCADGTIEAAFSASVVGCGATWKLQGLQRGQSACAAGWHICVSATEAAANGLTAQQCNDRAPPGTFFGTYQSSGGGWNCKTPGQNDIWGCGRSSKNFRISQEHAPCGVLTKAIGNHVVGQCNARVGCWENLNTAGGTSELASVRKSFAAGGGVLCCEVKTDVLTKGLVSSIDFEQGAARSATAVFKAPREMSCKQGGSWTRPSGDVPNSLAGIAACRAKCLAADPQNKYFGLECPKPAVHCQCAKTLKGSIKLPNTQCDRSNRPGSHCKGPYTAKGYMLGAHGTGSVYMIHTAPALPRVKAKVGPPAAISNAIVLKNGNLQLNSRGFADLGNTLSPLTTEMTLCMWVKLLRDHSSWHLLATKWDDRAPSHHKYFFHLGIKRKVLNLLMSEDGQKIRTVAEASTLLASDGLVHVCFTAQAAGAVRLYVDGVPAGKGGHYSAAKFPQIPASLMLGCKESGRGWSECGDFILDDFMLWNRVLSPEEIYAQVFVGTRDPAWGQLASAVEQTRKCPLTVFSTRADEVNTACCPVGGCSKSPPANGMPLSCPVSCGKVFIPFYDDCKKLLVEFLESNIVTFDRTAHMCLSVSQADLYGSIKSLKAKGCTFPDNEFATQGRRRTQLDFHHHLGGSKCPMATFTARTNAVNAACCSQSITQSAKGGCSETLSGVPDQCSINCGLAFMPYYKECSVMLKHILDKPGERAAFAALSNRCQQQNPRAILHAIGDADCAGGWQKLMSDVGYTGRSDSGKERFDRVGSFSRIAVVRKSGYVSCDCTNNPMCGPVTKSCQHNEQNCCKNPKKVWNLCEYIPGHRVANQDAPFEMSVNGNLLVQQASWNSAPHTGDGLCTTPAQTNGKITCSLPFSTRLSDTVVLSWNEGRKRASISDNCGTIVVDVYGCPGYQIKQKGVGYCKDYRYLPEGGYPPLKNVAGDHLQECAERCTKAYGLQHAFYIRAKDKQCACSKGSCSTLMPSSGYVTYSITKQAAKCLDVNLNAPPAATAATDCATGKARATTRRARGGYPTRSKPFTLRAWIRTGPSPRSDGILLMGDGAPCAGNLYLWIGSSGQFFFGVQCNAGSNPAIGSTVKAVPNTRYTIQAEYDGITAKLWVNGKLEAQAKKSFNWLPIKKITVGAGSHDGTHESYSFGAISVDYAMQRMAVLSPACDVGYSATQKTACTMKMTATTCHAIGH